VIPEHIDNPDAGIARTRPVGHDVAGLCEAVRVFTEIPPARVTLLQARVTRLQDANQAV
jgi:hypothetical protein